jgi:myo-inositol-1(or 4)-monophosphatase
MDLELIKRTGVGAAYKGSKILNDHFGKITKVTKKGVIDLVTVADTESEKTIIQSIQSRFPDHSILAEESGLSQGKTSTQWIIDPLDGTTNFTHHLGIFAVSIAFALNGNIEVGIVLNPVTGELFTAVKGLGAELNGRPISISDSRTVSESLLVTGFPYNIKDVLEPVLARFSNCVSASQGVRRLGSAALDLCYVACGRFDGFWEQNLKPWDTAAGMLIANEAGGVTTDFSNRPFTIDKNEILSTNGRIHKEMLSLLVV